MRALVLAAGLGTRLQPLTLARAKAAAPVDGEPLVRRTIRWLVAHGLRDLVVNLHHRPDTITAAVGDGSDLGARVRYSWESLVLGSAGGPRHALPLLLDPPSPPRGLGEAGLTSPPRGFGEAGPASPPRGEASGAERTCVIVNGDTLTSVDLAAMIERHRRTDAQITMAVIPNPRPDKYGGVLLDEHHAVTGFSRRGSPGPSVHFVGPQVIEADAFMPLEDGVPFESVLGLYPQLMRARPGSVMGFVSDAAFQDIGTPADLLRTSLDLAAADGRPGCPHWGRGVRVADSAAVTRSALWDNVTVGSGAVLDECIVADGVTIPDGAEYRRCAIVNDASGLLVAKLDAE
jgi:NDP-sugar pyrophosphorylase family protein